MGRAADLAERGRRAEKGPLPNTPSAFHSRRGGGPERGYARRSRGKTEARRGEDGERIPERRRTAGRSRRRRTPGGARGTRPSSEERRGAAAGSAPRSGP